MTRVTRILWEFAILSACISLSVAVSNPLFANIARISGYGIVGLIFAEWVIVAGPRLPEFFRHFFSIANRPLRVSMAAVLSGMDIYVLQLYGSDSGSSTFVVLYTIFSLGWLALEVVVWISGYGLYSKPAEEAPPAEIPVPAYTPDPPGEPDEADGLELFRDFINSLDLDEK